MLTKRDAISVGAAICKAAKDIGNDASATPTQRGLVRGTCLYALDIVWSETLNDRAKSLFGGSYQTYLDECGWPKD